MSRKQGRPRAGEAALTREAVLEAALDLIDSRGMAALTMRRLASELGVDPMAIYHHVDGKPALLSGVIALVFGGLRVVRDPDAEWQAQVQAFARAYHDLALAHPNLVLALVSEPEAGAEAALAASESLYTALAAAGLQPQQIVQAADLVVDYLNGYALGALAQPGKTGPQLPDLARRSAAEYPTLYRVFSNLADHADHGSYEAGLAIILMGIAALVGQSTNRQDWQD